jgi:hypothetical protein
MGGRAVRVNAHAEHVDAERIIARPHRDGPVCRLAQQRDQIRRRLPGPKRRPGKRGRRGIGVAVVHDDRQLSADRLPELRERLADRDVLRAAENTRQIELTPSRPRKRHDERAGRNENREDASIP